MNYQTIHTYEYSVCENSKSRKAHLVRFTTTTANGIDMKSGWMVPSVSHWVHANKGIKAVAVKFVNGGYRLKYAKD